MVTLISDSDSVFPFAGAYKAFGAIGAEKKLLHQSTELIVVEHWSN